MEKRLRAGLIGCGFFGQIQAEAWLRIPEVQLVAACDTDLERARSVCQRAYASAASMLAGETLDFVDIATRPESHLELVRLAAQHGVHAICQKPMAPSWQEAVAMLECAKAAGIRLIIHENWRWQPWFRVAREIISRGDIGEPITYLFRLRRNDGRGPEAYPAQPYFRQMPRLLVFETLVHHLDTARFIFGEIEAVYGQMRRLNPRIAGEDQAIVVVTHEGGLPGLVEGHRFLDLAPDGPVMGEAVFEGQEGILRVAPTGDLWLGERCVWQNRVHQGYRGDSVWAAQRHFARALLEGTPAESEGEEYLKTFAAVEAVYRSVAERRAVRLREVSG